MVGTRSKHVPQRRCIICNEQRPKQALMRVVRSPAGDLLLDAGPKVSGRGAYLCRVRECLRKAADGKRIARALDVTLSAEQAALLQQMAREAPPTQSDAGR